MRSEVIDLSERTLDEVLEERKRIIDKWMGVPGFKEALHRVKWPIFVTPNRLYGSLINEEGEAV